MKTSERRNSTTEFRLELRQPRFSTTSTRKRSLFGDHSIYGMEGVRFYTRLKTVTARWPTGIRSGVNLNFPSTN